MPLLKANSGLPKVTKSLPRSFPPEDSGQVPWLYDQTGGYATTITLTDNCSTATYTTASNLKI